MNTPSLNAAERAYEELYNNVEKCRRYDKALNEMEIPPNGDDYNAILDMMEGHDYREPHRTGR